MRQNCREEMDIANTPLRGHLQMHKQFGIFRYSEELQKQSITSPAEQITIIVWFVQYHLASVVPLPPVADEAVVELWMRTALAETVHHLRAGPEGSVLWDSLPTKLLTQWGLDEDFAELLNYICGPRAYTRAIMRLRAHGFQIRLTDIADLEAQFVLLRLPRAIRSFSPARGRGHEEAWLASVFYRYALQEVLVDLRSREHLSAVEARAHEPTTPASVLVQKEESALLACLPEAVQKLPAQERLATELYFGFSGPEKSLADIGRELEVSEYLARTAVVRGLAMLSVLLGVSGPLNDTESQLLRLTFLDGMTVARAALQLHMSPAEARKILAGIGTKFRMGLRPRTGHKEFAASLKENVMSTQNSRPQLDKTPVTTWLKGLTETPPLRRSEGGELEVQFDNHWFNVADVRQIALLPDIAPILEAANIPVAWLFAPEPARKLDLSAEVRLRLHWAQVLQQTHQRSWQTAEVLYWRCVEMSSRGKDLFTTGDHLDPIEMIHSSLAALSYALESRLRTGKHTNSLFCIQQESGSPIGQWEGEETSLELAPILASRARRLGELPADAIETLTQSFAQEVFVSDLTLPGFRRASESTSDRVLLKLLPRTTKALLAEFEQIVASESTLSAS